MTVPASAMRIALDKQIDWYTAPPPFTARLLAILRDDLDAGGVMASVVESWAGEPIRDAVPLRLAGAFHFLALSGSEPGLARLYPPRGSGIADDLTAEVLAVARRRLDVLARFIQSPPQTNEVGRSGVMLGGFLVVAQRTRLPLRLFEIGASAGLNSSWHRYRYEIGGATWGDPASPVRLAPRWSGSRPPLDVTPTIAARAACDRAPIDVRDPSERLRLISYVWPDQAERLARIEAAIALGQQDGVRVERADAAAWLEARLAQPHPGTATVVFHSVMWQYLAAHDQDRIAAILRIAGAAASPEAPFAWLRFEPTPGMDAMELRLTLWPGGQELRLAAGHPHGSDVTWFGTEAG